jgi:predicted phosphohydrolase
MAIKIQYCSDLHLEFKKNKEYLDLNPLPIIGDILILAGDIVPFAVIDDHKQFFDYLSDNFKSTYWIPGNHEYYRYDIANKKGSFLEKIRSNVFLLNNYVINLEEVDLVFSTLWSHISPPNELEIQYSVTDFYSIKYYGGRFTPYHFNKFHQESLDFLKPILLRESSKPTVVATHHVPTFLNYPKKFENDILNEAFVVELHDLIVDSCADYWIYGHIHENTPEFKVGKTSLLTSQLGYVNHGQHRKFNASTCIEIV